jgi:hypothetical protein
MNKTETTVFFRLMHNAEEEIIAPWGTPSNDYAEGYDSVMDDVKFAIMSGDAKDMYELDELINQLDAYGVDNEPGAYANGYQDAVNLCLKAVSQLFQSVEV